MTLSQQIKDVEQARRARLVNLAAWAAGEDVKRRLGLPSEWNQHQWFGRAGCGTTCCIAGKLAAEEGGIPLMWDPDNSGEIDFATARARWLSDDFSLRFDDEFVLFDGDDEAQGVQAWAAGALGLDAHQADRLFQGDNNLEDIILIVGDLLGVQVQE